MGTVRAALRSGYRDLRRRDLNIGQLCRERFWRSGSLGHYMQSSASQQFDAFVCSIAPRLFSRWLPNSASSGGTDTFAFGT
ncbi:hypothetical protein [Mesorhizobium sp. L103C131B0]|uniref:hypothetical protein n=2 Tax=unclassified Mesorhizobium TaxID=325217 RepID=UPI0003D061BC|nr:hypothetical protein [Mesorhizobium sp. L103C131B0]ESZ63234.1 hypothetical protein X729_08480 [Mesorhizobium sp. L103C131B0]